MTGLKTPTKQLANHQQQKAKAFFKTSKRLTNRQAGGQTDRGSKINRQVDRQTEKKEKLDFITQ